MNSNIFPFPLFFLPAKVVQLKFEYATVHYSFEMVSLAFVAKLAKDL